MSKIRQTDGRTYGAIADEAELAPATARFATGGGGGLKGTQAAGLILLSSCLASGVSLCIVASKVNGTEQYAFVTVTLLSEITKGLVSLLALMAYSDDGPSVLQLLGSREGWYYAIPALLYMLDNNLAFLILRYIDAATQSLLWNIKIVQTAVLFRFFLGRRLSQLKWLSVAQLFFGILGSQSSKIHTHMKGELQFAGQESAAEYSLGVLLIVIGTSITSMAGIWTEWVLKKHSTTAFFKQQALLYLFGAIFNSIALFTGSGKEILANGFFHGYNRYAVVVIVLMAGNGLATATIFKHLDNIMNIYTQAGNMLITAAVSTCLGTFVPNIGFVCGACVCLIAMYMYNCGLETLLSGASADYYEQHRGVTITSATDEAGKQSSSGSAAATAMTGVSSSSSSQQGQGQGQSQGQALPHGRRRYRIARVEQEQ